MVASEITPKEDVDVCIAGSIKSVRAGGGSGDIFTNSDLFVMHCDNLLYIVLQICITPDPGESERCGIQKYLRSHFKGDFPL